MRRALWPPSRAEVELAVVVARELARRARAASARRPGPRARTARRRRRGRGRRRRRACRSACFSNESSGDEHRGDAALRPARSPTSSRRALGDDHDLAVRGGAQREREPGDAAAEHEKVGGDRCTAPRSSIAASSTLASTRADAPEPLGSTAEPPAERAELLESEPRLVRSLASTKESRVKILVAAQARRRPGQREQGQDRRRRATRSTPTGLEWKLNPFDEYALEAALRLTENGKAPKQRAGRGRRRHARPEGDRDDAARRARDRRRPRDPRRRRRRRSSTGAWSRSRSRASSTRRSPTSSCMGKQAVDGDSNQVGQLLAELLDWPMATFAATIKEEAGRAARRPRGRRRRAHAARQAAGGGHGRSAHRRADQRVLAARPTPRFKYNDGVRFAPLPAIMAAKKKPLDVKTLADLVAGRGAHDALSRSSSAPPRARPASRSRTWPSSSNKLANEAKVI